ncbi:MAG: hypothetical protein Q7R65_02915, partial [bacterium]|nr:hypothetical protein [bacterium]
KDKETGKHKTDVPKFRVDNSTAQQTKSSESRPPHPEPVSPNAKTKEVPEDVLRKLLKVDKDVRA